MKDPYKIVSDKNPLQVAIKSSELAREGYEPSGDLIYVEGLYLQPMFKSLDKFPKENAIATDEDEIDMPKYANNLLKGFGLGVGMGTENG